MDMIPITDHHGQLVADSRLIAQELDIQHKNFLETVLKYLDVIQEAFGPVAFETRVVKRPQGGTYEERWAWLNEDQATLVMTFSRNNAKVVRCKVALVKGFSQAKKRLERSQPTQPTPPPRSTPAALPPNSFMSAELSPDNELYQLFREAGKREIVRKFFVS